MDYQIIDIRTIDSGGKGSLSFFEGGKDVPFDIRRIYYIHEVPGGIWRGSHAHRHLRQMLWCPYGRIDIRLDDGERTECVRLDNPSKGLVLGSMVWRDMKWVDEGSVLAVAASEYYDEADYIRDYEEFKREVESRNEGSVH